jgi:hypothetical protein
LGRRRWRHALVGVAAAVGVVLSAAAIDHADVTADTGLPVGAHDFIAYWAAFDATSDGGDPYDEPSLRAVERELHPRYESGAQRYWNPPWALLLLSPVLVLPFELATSVWLLLTLTATIVAGFVSWRLFVDRTEPLPPLALLAVVASVPLIECLRLGQMSSVVALAVLGAFLALREGYDGTAGVLLALSAAKPQVAALAVLAVGVAVVIERRWRVVWTGAGTFATVAICSYLVHPSAWAGWDPFSISPSYQFSPTIAGWIRNALPATDGGRPAWPMILVPLCALIVLALWLWRRRGSLDWTSVPTLLAVSLLVVPFSGVYDGVILVPIHVVIVGAVVKRRSGAVWALVALIAVHAGALAVRSLEASDLHHLIIVPIGLLALYQLIPAEWARREEDVVIDLRDRPERPHEVATTSPTEEVEEGTSLIR